MEESWARGSEAGVGRHGRALDVGQRVWAEQRGGGFALLGTRAAPGWGTLQCSLSPRGGGWGRPADHLLPRGVLRAGFSAFPSRNFTNKLVCKRSHHSSKRQEEERASCVVPDFCCRLLARRGRRREHIPSPPEEPVRTATGHGRALEPRCLSPKGASSDGQPAGQAEACENCAEV